MTNEQMKLEAEKIAIRLGYGRSDPNWDVTVTRIVALCQRVREGQRENDVATCNAIVEIRTRKATGHSKVVMSSAAEGAAECAATVRAGGER